LISIDMERPIYLDHHATTPTDGRVVEAMLPYFTERFGNAASRSHRYGWEAAEAVERARSEVAELIGASAREVVFTSGATEANNLALKGLFSSRGRAGERGHLVVTAAEHRAVLDPARRLERMGIDLTVVPVDEHAAVDPQRIIDALRPHTRLVSVIWANNEVGTLNPIGEIADACRERGVPLHTDAVQALGRVPVPLDEVPADLVSVSAHKLYGPKGVGALIVRRGAEEGSRRMRLSALLDGGAHEGGLRSGTLPVPLIVGFGEACRLAREEMPRESERIARLRDDLWRGLRERLDGLTLNGHPQRRLPGNLHVSVDGVDGEALLSGLTKIAVSSGAACSSADPEPSHVLRAMGRSDRQALASLRFGLGRGNTAADIEAAAEHVSEVVRRLR
jgi:cysteine desulfurase